MEFRVLGSIEIVHGDRVALVAAPKQRELLALLLINANTTLSRDRIMDELWGDDAPGIGTLRFHISKLRSLLGVDPSPIVTTDNGYRLNVDPHSVDAAEFEAAVVAAGAAVESSLEEATDHIARAGGLWRGAPYPGAEYRPFAEIEIGRLNELYLTYLARRMEVELARGRHDEAVPDLEEMVSRYPLHERFWELLMLALYRSGRQAEALRAFKRAQEILGQELGIAPSAALADLEEKILLQAPAISYVSTRPSNLPTHVSRFVGRSNEIADLKQLVLGERMVSLTGPGGIGKTRLAVEVGHSLGDRFPGGTWFFDLAGTEEGGVISSVIASLPIEEQADEDPLGTVVHWAQDRAALLIVDNCEHLVSEVGDVVLGLVLQCPQVHVVATSRERLGVDGEHVWVLDGLALPKPEDDADQVRASDAVKLLVDRAQRADRAFLPTPDEVPILAELAATLDGIPLALELAAARFRNSTVEEVLSQIRVDMAALDDKRRRGPLRHRTMRTALDWSYRLLAPEAAAVWRKLGVFRGGFTTVAAGAVVGNLGPGVLDHLVDVSLVKVVRGLSPKRYRMLEVVRDYAEALLEPEEKADAVRAHIGYFVTLAAEQAELLGGGDQAIAIEALRSDHDNLRQAILNARAVGSADEVALVARLGTFWFDVGFHSEARVAFAAAIGDGNKPPSLELANALEQLVQLYSWSGSVERAFELADLQNDVAQALGDHDAKTRVLASRAILGFVTGDYRTAIDSYERMLVDPGTAKTASVAYVAASLGYLYTWTGDQVRADECFTNAMDHARRFALDERAGMAGDYLGWVAFQNGDLEEALSQWRAGQKAYAELGLRPMAADMRQLQGWALLAMNDYSEAETALEESIADIKEVGLASYVARGAMLEAVARFQSNEDEALQQLAAAVRKSDAVRSRPTLAWGLWYGASLAADQDRRDDCASLRNAAESVFESIPLVLPAGFRSRDAEMLDFVGQESWVAPSEGFDVDTASDRVLGASDS